MLRALALALLALAGGLACRSAPPVPAADTAAADTTGARLLLAREAGTVRVTPLYDAPPGAPGTLRYALEVLREGTAGRSSTRQAGTFVPRPGRTDTLSVATVDVAPGDRLRIHLRLFSADELVDEVHRDEVVSAAD